MTAIYKSEAGAAAIQDRYREVLRAWPVPADELHIPTREGDTFVLASGPADAPPLVLLHGSGSNSSTWRGDIASWATHFRVYAVDIVGEPGGSARSRPVLGTDGVSLWLDDVVDGLGLSSFALTGMSLGGWMATDYATRRPERVTRLALLCPGGIGKQKYGWLLKEILPRLLGRHDARRSASTVTGLTEPEFATVLDDVVLIFEHFNPRREKLPRFTDAELQRLTMPVLVMVGDQDVMMDSVDTARRIRANIPAARVNLLPGMGHAVTGQTETVLKFLLDS
ncbi:alpha/beta fold hydrolase [Nocardia sp. NPDC020380]|uniref:alpha/beta fold hydrolase n=1 Tax=Nocardia sp. NPDC020380 TaxID=3364309 RepID=UPI0037880F15